VSNDTTTVPQVKRCNRCQQEFPDTTEYFHWGKWELLPFCIQCQEARWASLSLIYAHREEHRGTYAQREKAAHVNRRARLKNAPGSFAASDLDVQRRAQTDRRGVVRCWWCSEPLGDDQTVDHRIPLAKGGSNNPDNLVLAHLHCNCSKGAKMPWEFNGRLI
jgi:hypothetical protein